MRRIQRERERERERESASRKMGAPRVGVWLATAVVLVTLSAPKCAKGGEPEFCGRVKWGSYTGEHKCGDDNCCKGHFCGNTGDFCDPDKGCDNTLGRCDGKCFPGNSIVRTRGNGRKPISELRVGDEVAVWSSKEGQLEYEPVYAQGHQDAKALTAFVSITLKSAANVSRTLQLTPDHFVIAVEGNDSTTGYKKAKDVSIGDVMMAMDDELHVSTFLVSDVQERLMYGLYNPITTSGTIIVNDVVASCHSHWFLDAFFDKLAVSHLIPSAYQVLLTPARILYNLMGEKAYTTLYNRVSPHVDIATSMKNIRGYLQLLLMSLEYLHEPTKERI